MLELFPGKESERYHAEDTGEAELDLPLFQPRGLFRDSVSA